MINFILIYYRNIRLMILSFIIIPFIFIGLGKFSMLAISFMTFGVYFTSIFDNFNYALCLPISRRDIVKGNYLGYFILVLTNIIYLFTISEFGKKFLNLKIEGINSLLGAIYSISILAIFSLYIPFAIRYRNQHNYKFVGIFPIAGFLLMSVVYSFAGYLARINIIYHLLLMFLIVSFFLFIGFRDSIKNIEKVDF